MKSNSLKKNQQSGFTLVELSIALIIIGLLIGGIIKSQEMMSNARIASTINTFENIQAAISTFQESYGTVPGDMRSALTRLSNCNDDTFCQNGDGNGIIASDGSDQHNWRSTFDNTVPEAEAFQFWKHLALANLLKSVQSNGDPDNPMIGTTNPSTPLGGVLEFYYDGGMRTGNGNDETKGHIARLSANNFAGEPAGAITTQKAWIIDQKIDDGRPNTGYVIADYGVTDNDCKETNGTTSNYLPDNSNARCIIYVKFFR